MPATVALSAELAALAARVLSLEASRISDQAAFKALLAEVIADEAKIAALTPPPIITPPYDPQVQWSAGFEGGNLFEFEGQNNSGSASSSAVQAAAEGIVAHTGNWVMKQSVTGDPGGTRMYVYSTINNLYRTGNPIYYSFWVYFPQATTLAGGWFNLLQIQSVNASGTTDPVWILGLHPSNFALRLEWWSVSMSGPHAGENGGKAYDQLTPIPVGKWTFIEVGVTPREDFTGAVKVWQNGALIFDMANVKTKYPEANIVAGAQSFFISKNAYGQAILPTPNSHYVDDVTISLGRIPYP